MNPTSYRFVRYFPLHFSPMEVVRDRCAVFLQKDMVIGRKSVTEW